ncbi:MAG: glutamine synthetase family protein [Gammaproteobacteria bacterium]|nr:glutamine synthetase family protein [Gammaproteobacteria bacterium]
MADFNQGVKDFLKIHPNLSHLDVLIIDLCGNAIGKRLPASSLASVFEHGSPVCGAMQLVDVLGNTNDPMGYGFSDGDPDAYAIPIPGTLSPVPWLSGDKCQVLCEFIDAKNTSPLWYEPRQVLKKVLQKFSELGLTPRLAVELEFYLIDPARDSSGIPQPAKSPRTGLTETGGRVLSLDKLDEFDAVLKQIEDSCHSQGIPTTSMISEYGAGQFEINLQHQDDIMAAADHAVLLRRAVQGVSRAMGYDATFMSKPFAGQSGNGMHIHLSLIDRNGNNVFEHDSNTLNQSIAGLQATMAESLAVFAPNVNAYRRFKPDEFVPVTKDWGENNRSVAFRIPPSDPANRRIEHRISGAEANPYLVIACILSGIHYGISQGLDSGNPHSGNAGSEVDESLPSTIWQAISAMRQATVLPQYLGSEYLDIYCDVKQAEFAAFMEDIHTREYEWYL